MAPIKNVSALKKLEEEVLNQECECVKNEKSHKRKSTKKDETFVEEKKAKTPAKKKPMPKSMPQRVPKAVGGNLVPIFTPLMSAVPCYKMHSNSFKANLIWP